MLDNEYSNFLKEDLFKFFEEIFIIDILSDKVSIYENNSISFVEKNKLSFFDFVQNITPLIHPEDVNNYFDYLSVNKLEENNGGLTFNYRYKRKENNYSKYINLISLNNNNGQKLVFVAVLKDNLEKTHDDSNKLQSRINSISNSVSDVILKIYNTLDSTSENRTTNKYIINLLDNLIREFPEFNKQFEKDIKLQINKSNNTLLIVDDDTITRNLIKKTFKDEYEIIEAVNGEVAIDLLNKNGTSNIVGIFLDLFMPVLDGFSVLDYLKQNNILSKIPVIIISGVEEKETRQRVYQYNIADLLEKPFNLEIIKYRTKNLINLYKTSDSLNSMILSQHKDLLNVIEKLKEAYLFDNKERIEKISKYLKILLTKVKDNYKEYKITDYIIDKVLEAVPICNVGLYTLPRYIGRNGKFSEEEINLLKEYPNINKIIVEKHLAKYNDLDLLNIACDLASYSHEKFNGSGYPLGIKEDDIPITAQCNYIATLLEIILSENANISNEEIMKKYFDNINMEFNPKLISILSAVLDEIRTL